MFTRVRNLTILWSRLIQSASSYCISWRSMLTFSSHLPPISQMKNHFSKKKKNVSVNNFCAISQQILLLQNCIYFYFRSAATGRVNVYKGRLHGSFVCCMSVPCSATCRMGQIGGGLKADSLCSVLSVDNEFCRRFKEGVIFLLYWVDHPVLSAIWSPASHCTIQILAHSHTHLYNRSERMFWGRKRTLFQVFIMVSYPFLNCLIFCFVIFLLECYKEPVVEVIGLIYSHLYCSGNGWSICLCM
jgi:hypothetical protein